MPDPEDDLPLDRLLLLLLDETELERLDPTDEDLLIVEPLPERLDEDLNEDDPELLTLLLPVDEEERLIMDLVEVPDDDLFITDRLVERLIFVFPLDERL